MVYIVLPYGVEKVSIAASVMMPVSLALFANNFLRGKECQNKATGRVLTEIDGNLGEVENNSMHIRPISRTRRFCCRGRSSRTIKPDKLPLPGSDIDSYV